MIPQPNVVDLEQAAENLYWRKRLRVEQHRASNRPMDEETRNNIRAYWQSILELREEQDESEENVTPVQ